VLVPLSATFTFTLTIRHCGHDVFVPIFGIRPRTHVLLHACECVSGCARLNLDEDEDDDYNDKSIDLFGHAV
jgi:hypothetical protein